MRVVIIDDEPPARAKIRRLLAEEPDVTVVGEAEDGETAVEVIRRLAPQLIFLDVQMPRAGGFEVLSKLAPAERPAVVFVTAFDHHAVAAFEVEALDYVLKPFAAERFRRALARARERLKATPEDLAQRLERLLATVSTPRRFVDWLLVEKSPGREVLLPVESIDLLRADGNWVKLFSNQGELVRRATLTELAAQLDPERFVRINRSEVVRLAAIVELQPWSHGDRRVVLSNGLVLSWSRRYRAGGGIG